VFGSNGYALTISMEIIDYVQVAEMESKTASARPSRYSEKIIMGARPGHLKPGTEVGELGAYFRRQLAAKYLQVSTHLYRVSQDERNPPWNMSFQTHQYFWCL
jgi:hypothetical protein